MFPTNSERLIGVSDAFLPLFTGIRHLAHCIRSHCTPNKSVPTLRYTDDDDELMLNVLRCHETY